MYFKHFSKQKLTNNSRRSSFLRK